MVLAEVINFEGMLDLMSANIRRLLLIVLSVVDIVLKFKLGKVWFN
jgi:hypothetical protein